jgi:hypothetical protein
VFLQRHACAAALRLCALISVAFGSCGIARAQAPEVWLGGVDSNARRKMFQETDSDFMEMFRDNARWEHAASHTSVFQINAGFILNSPDDEVRTVFAALKRRRICLAVEALMLSGKDGCGVGMEGFSAPATMAVVASRIQKLGGELCYIAMDEPMWYGHVADGRTACHATPELLAKDIAHKIGDVKRIFPSLKVGDVEPTGIPKPADWIEQLIQWTEIYRAVIGQPLDFLHVDVRWVGPWQVQLRQLVPALRSKGIRFGVIYNGPPSARDSQEWTNMAERRANEVESDPSLVPNQAIIQSWSRLPTRFLPESENGTMTNLVDQYLSR